MKTPDPQAGRFLNPTCLVGRRQGFQVSLETVCRRVADAADKPGSIQDPHLRRLHLLTFERGPEY